VSQKEKHSFLVGATDSTNVMDREARQRRGCLPITFPAKI
jgi:hypothetical protein